MSGGEEWWGGVVGMLIYGNILKSGTHSTGLEIRINNK